MMTRYEIDDGAAWDDAEKQVKQAAKSGKAHPLVSVKSKAKRKAEETDGRDERAAEKGHSKSKKAKREKKR